jgi:hypothetical protein
MGLDAELMDRAALRRAVISDRFVGGLRDSRPSSSATRPWGWMPS